MEQRDSVFNPLADVKIYQINIGRDPKNGMGFRVGQQFWIGEERYSCEIIKIIRNETNYHLFGVITYEIWAKITDSRSKKNGKEFIYKFFENMPVHVTQVGPSTKAEKYIDEKLFNYINENSR